MNTLRFEELAESRQRLNFDCSHLRYEDEMRLVYALKFLFKWTKFHGVEKQINLADYDDETTTD